MKDMENLGFVPIEEIANIFTTELSTIEADIHRNGVPLDPKIIFEWMDQIRGKLFKRAKWHIDEYVRQNPVQKVKEHQEREKTPKASYKESWEQKVKTARQQAISDCYK